MAANTSPGIPPNSVAPRFESQSQCEQFVKKAVSSGQLLVAIHAARDGLAAFDSLVLRQQLALALVQTGSFEPARQALASLVLKGDKSEETLCLMGRVYKELWRHEADKDQALVALQKSREFYGEAYNGYHTYYPGINLAFVLAMSGQRTQAEQCAREVAQLCRAQISATKECTDGWLWATLAEAHVQLSEFPLACETYHRALQLLTGRWRDISTMRRQVRELLRHRGEDPATMDGCFDLPTVIAFVGHMLDRPERGPPRFPPECEPNIRKKIDKFLDKAKPGFGYCSAACGADILFCESLVQRGGEAHLVLPCPIPAFKTLSVNFAGKEWEQRFDRVLDLAKTCSIANPAEATASESSPLSPLGYVYTNHIITGLAALQARSLDLELRTLAVWDGQSGDGPGGTASAIIDWIAQRRSPYIIRPNGANPQRPAKPRLPKVRSLDRLGLAISEMQQDIKAILFADVVGYSRLSEGQIRPFTIEFMGAISRLIVRTTPPPVVMHTWGDGLYFIFDRVHAAASFALKLRDLVTHTAWHVHGLPSDLSIRIGIHAGPVFAYVDPVMRQFTFTGGHVTRAARIEPVTAPGQIYTSQEFAALCAAEGVVQFAFEYLGQLPTAKNFGHAPLYRLYRKQDRSPGK